VKGGDPKELFNAEQAKDLRPETRSNMFTWSSDGKSIYFADQLSNEEGYGCQLYRISVKSGNITNLGLKSEGYFMSLNAHPDGRHFVYSAKGKSNSEVWMMEDFLPSQNLAENNTPEKEQEGIVIKQVWNDEKVDDTGTITPDGKYLSFVDWETGDLALRNLKTGTNERLTGEGTWEEPMHFAVNNVISPDGKKIAYSWFNDKGTYDLKIIDVNAKNVSTLYATEKDEEIYPVSWLPGSSELMVQYSKKIDDSYEIYLSLINTTSSSITHLKEFHTPFMTNLSVSGNGKIIAFDFPNPDDDGNFDINIMTKDGKNEHTVIQHPANDRVLGWIPGSDKFLFVSNRSGAYDIYAMEIVNDKIKNEPVKIVTDIGKISPVSFTEDGTLFYSNYRRNFNAFTVPVSAGGEISINERNHLLGPAFDVSWLPDGKNLVCLKYEETNGYYIPSVYNTEKNEFRPLIKKQNLVSIGYLNLSPDGKSVLLFGSEMGKEKGQLYQVDIETGVASPVKILNEPETAITLVEWNNDGKSFFYVHNNNIIKHNILTGKEEPVLTGKKILIRADILKLHKEKHLIFVEQENENEELLKSISLESGEEKIICKFNNKWSGYGFRELVYFPPTKDFYFSFNENGSLLYRVDENGGEPEIMWDSDKIITGLSVHPNNDKLTISVHELEQEIRKIENLEQEIEKIYAEKE
jgi:Tol biopolymer transport system component